MLKKIYHKKGSRRLSQRDFSEKTFYYLKMGLSKNAPQSYARLLDFTTQKYGYSSTESHNVALQIMICFKQDIPQELLPNLVRIFSLHKDQGNLELALSFNRNSLRLHQSIHTAYLTESDVFFVHNKDFSQEHFTGWLRSTLRYEADRLSKLFKSDINSFCLVGNSAALLSKGLGEVIDQYKYVIRFNEFKTQGFEKDVGGKTSLWVVNKGLLNKKSVKVGKQRVQSWVVCSNNYEFKERNFQNHLRERYVSDGLISIVPPTIFSELIQEIECLPSSGLAIAYWMYKESGAEICRKSIFGFSHFSELKFEDHYFVGSDIKQHVHNWNKEVKVFERITR